MLAILLAISPAVPAATFQTFVSGSIANSTNSCPVATAANLDDCSYNASDPILGGGTGAAEWVGPLFGSGYYSGAGPGPDTTPTPGDGKASLGLSGSITIADNNDGFGANDLLSLSLTLASGTRNSDAGSGFRMELSWTSITWTLAFTQVDSVSGPNGFGGFDYVIAGNGFPNLLTDLATGTDSFPSETASSSSALVDGSYWAAAGSSALNSFHPNPAFHNIGASLAVGATGWSCTAGSDGASCSGRTVASEQSWNNLLLKISADSLGNVVAVSGFGVHETDQLAAPVGLDSWESDYFTLTAVPVPGAVWLFLSALAALGLRRRAAATLAVVCVATGLSSGPTWAADPYQSATTSFTFFETYETGETLPAEEFPMAAQVFYPAALANGAPIPAGTTFPATLFLQGGNVDACRYSWLEGLARRGYIVVLPDKYPVTATRLNGENGTNTNTKLTNVRVLDGSVKRLHAWALESDSPIFGRFDGQVHVAGHSLGSVIAIIGVDQLCLISPTDPRLLGGAGGVIGVCPAGYSLDPSITGMWLIGGHFENPNGPPDFTPIEKPANFPIYLIAGEHDGASTIDEVQATYRRYKGPKIYYELPGANHLGWTTHLHPQDDMRNETPATITPEAQHAATIDVLTPFLDCYLKNDLTACGEIPATPFPPAP